MLAHVPAHAHALIVGRSFFPQLISPPFRTGLHEAFAFAIGACLIAALASFSFGRRYVDQAGHDLGRREDARERPAPAMVSARGVAHESPVG